MLPKGRRVVSPKEFDRLFKKDALIAKFASLEEEDEYEKRDSLLIRLIRKEIRQQFGGNVKKQPYVIDDWWPDHTRFLEAEPKHCTAAFLRALRRLLKNEYKDYRIQICVYEHPLDSSSYIGSMVLYKDRVLIEKRLHALFERERLI